VSQVQQGLAAAERIFEVTRPRHRCVPLPAFPWSLERLEGRIDFEGREFRLRGRAWVLLDVNLVSSQGRKVA
jgi:ABC-type multidrug transport system fused ATPase/permease subunit